MRTMRMIMPQPGQRAFVVSCLYTRDHRNEDEARAAYQAAGQMQVYRK